MLPRTKYNRFRNDSVTSVDDLLHNLSVSGGSKVSAARAAPAAAAPYLVSGDALRRAPDDGSGSLGHLLHKVSHLKLASSGLRGLSAARERAGARLSGSCSAPSLAAPDGSAPPGPRAPAMRAAGKGRPGSEPPPRAPPASDQVLGAGVTYVVKVGAGEGRRVGKFGCGRVRSGWVALQAGRCALLRSQLSWQRAAGTTNAPAANPLGEGLKTVTSLCPGFPWPHFSGIASPPRFAKCPASAPLAWALCLGAVRQAYLGRGDHTGKNWAAVMSMSVARPLLCLPRQQGAGFGSRGQHFQPLAAQGMLSRFI